MTHIIKIYKNINENYYLNRKNTLNQFSNFFNLILKNIDLTLDI
jgi:hypothetical protein